MSATPAALAALIEAFVRLPGIGPKTAQRLAFHLLKVPREQAAGLAEAIVALKDRTRFCVRCFNIAEEATCGICLDPRRDGQLLCVVEEVNDLLAVEKSREYRGLYHVLGGSLSPLEGRGPDQIRGKELHDKAWRQRVEGVARNTEAQRRCRSIEIHLQETAGISFKRRILDLSSDTSVE